MKGSRKRVPRRQATRTRVWRIAGVLVLIGAEAFLYGYSYPFFSLALEKRELANWLIGLNASIANAGILFVGPFLPRLIDRFGLKYVVATMFGISFLSFAAILAADNLTTWFLARFVMGTCFAALWTTTEIWLNGVVDDRNRGRIIGASGTLYAACQFMGPVALGAIGVTGPVPLIAAMLPLAVGTLVALSIRSPDKVEEEEEHANVHGLKLALMLAGPLVAAAFLCGIGETAFQSLLPLYGLAHGFDDAGAAGLVAIFSLGEAVLVAVLGWAADRYGRHLTLNICVIVATLTSVLLPLTIGNYFLLAPVLFFAGGTVAGIYTLGIVLIGQDFRNQRLAIVSTGFAMSYATGCIFGSAPVGYLIDLLGPEALPITIALGFLALAIFLLLGGGQRPVEDEDAPKRRVPSMAFLEDSLFEEAPAKEAAEDASADAVPTPSHIRFLLSQVEDEPTRPSPTPPPPPRASPSQKPRSKYAPEKPRGPVYDLEETFKQRAAEIAAQVAERQKPPPKRPPPAPPPPEPAAAPEKPPSPFAPRKG
jgi:MFS family permease